MDHTLVGVAGQRRMVMELGISPQDMIGHKEVGVFHVLHSLDKRPYGARVCTDLGLGKNSSYLHTASPWRSVTLSVSHTLGHILKDQRDHGAIVTTHIGGEASVDFALDLVLAT